ncbi:G-protein coupled receptor Mth2-like [Odontomachus brunneus]|uniref:G-protein coupled receptor Mth2-like n=1 Tax=Odontomachus brunneus TaxID=486640 RepID=UPI0013F1BF7D|nr:G-protein coupled receptor Mth2-like [Odontomachus brunneus]XP_032665066.1 G-protein coupled receptor Mth2-like [Odontomachus brunneus]XP_032665067.1 G-protein coupled receptor Mth2-like [Odontomachus brunneus]XP_032665068.1 G-protein coupled receptor Mth2-like [Odontomachus brunneus]XP_032665069.1 G-protein coupled receptor Mth2-like [Odontomachus brunneus]XP_032665070.1 G-protein coupled receptor Mth2-like [Odontomachus brunneus]
MCRLNPIVWWALLLVVAYAAENQSNSTHEDKQQDDTMHYEPHVNITTTWDHDENSTRDDEDSVQHEFYNNYTKNLDEKSSQNVPAELRDKSTETSDGGNSTTSQLRPGSNSNETNSKNCNETVCIPICCELGYRMIRGICTPDDSEYDFPEVHEIGKKVNEVFPLFVSNPCVKGHYLLDSVLYSEDEYIILTNGSVHQTLLNSSIDPTSYCFTVMNKRKYELIKCFDVTFTTVERAVHFTLVYIGIFVSLPFLLLTFVVYTILPELWNMHGYILRGYVGSLLVAYIILGVFQFMSDKPDGLSDAVCIGSAFGVYFSFMASFFWLNVMCFDIWWAFGGFRSLQKSVKQQEKKKFIMYSIYVWGCTFILTILCLIMDFVPNIPKNVFRPRLGHLRCWLTTEEANSLYFFLPIGITVICNIFLFIFTALKIVQQKKDMAHQQKSSESRRHDYNKQRFNLYLKLFIIMGITKCMNIITWMFKNTPPAVWYICDMTNVLQGLIIFIIFVWKDKIRKLLLKKFGCREDIFSRNSTRSGCPSTSSSHTITTGVSLQKKINPYVQNLNCRAKNSSDENSTDCSNV